MTVRPELKNIIDKAAVYMQTRLESGKTLGPWGEDYSQGFRSALETLNRYNPDLMQSIAGVKKDPV